MLGELTPGRADILSGDTTATAKAARRGTRQLSNSALHQNLMGLSFTHREHEQFSSTTRCVGEGWLWDLRTEGYGFTWYIRMINDVCIS